MLSFSPADNGDVINYRKNLRNDLAAVVAFAFVDGAGYTAAPAVVFTGGGGSGAAATAIINNGAVTGFNITNAGTGYTSAPAISFTGGGGGTGAAATAVLQGGTIGEINVTNPGTNGKIITITDNTAYAAGDSREAVNVEAFDKFGHKGWATVPAGSATATINLGFFGLVKTEGISMTATVTSVAGRIKDGSVHNVATLLTSGNFTMEK